MIGGHKRRERSRAAVARSVVDENQLILDPPERLRQRGVKRPDALLFIEDRDDDGYVPGSRPVCATGQVLIDLSGLSCFDQSTPLPALRITAVTPLSHWCQSPK